MTPTGSETTLPPTESDATTLPPTESEVTTLPPTESNEVPTFTLTESDEVPTLLMIIDEALTVPSDAACLGFFCKTQILNNVDC